MRPVHRPIHELTILPEIWDQMTPDEQIVARAQGKIRLPVRRTKKIKSIFFLSLILIYFYPNRVKENF